MPSVGKNDSTTIISQLLPNDNESVKTYIFYLFFNQFRAYPLRN
jgi:hypothetical protein